MNSTCSQCPRARRSGGRSGGRGLCVRCYSREHKAGRLHQYPLKNRAAADVAEDVEFLRGQGFTRRQMAERLGMTLAAMDRALLRHRARQRAA